MAKREVVAQAKSAMGKWLAVASAALLSCSVLAAPGDLDTTFGGGKGWSAAGFAGSRTEDQLHSVIVQTDGKIVIAGSRAPGSTGYDFVLLRYNADGSPDPVFGSGGKLVTNFSSTEDHAVTVIQQADGKLVVAGYSGTGNNNNLALARYNSIDGTLDGTFGSGGKVVTDFGGANEYSTSVIQQADGKLIVAGNEVTSLGTAFYKPIVVRYNVDGTLDTTFDTDGKVTLSMGGSARVRQAVQQADGKLMLVGYLNSATTDTFMVRLLSDGAIDSTFGTSGKVVTDVRGTADSGYAVIQQPDSKLVVAGSTSDGYVLDTVLLRYTATGVLDTTFDGDGKVITKIGGVDDFANSLLLQPDGKLVVSGLRTNVNDYVYVARYNSNGSLDTTFDADGIQTASWTTSYNRSESMARQADGKLVVVGYTSNGDNTDGGVMRFNVDGSLDTAFDGDGKFVVSVGIPTDAARSVIRQADGKLVAAGFAYDGDTKFALARYTSDGVLDSTFDSDGKVTLGSGSGKTVIQQADGKFVMAGAYYGNIRLDRVDINGAVDTSFDGDGRLSTSLLGSGVLLQQTNGKLVVGGHVNSAGNDDIALERYNADGTLDIAFGIGGKAVAAIGAGNEYTHALLQQKDGKLVAVGYSNNGVDDDIALVRFNTDGTLDASFDVDGKLTTAVGSSNDYAFAVVQQPSGKLVIAGSSSNGVNADITVVRYNMNGSLDTTFSGDGIVTTAVGKGDDAAYALVTQPDGKLIVSGASDGGATGNDVVLIAYNINGSKDNGFANNGVARLDISSSSQGALALLMQPDGYLVTAGFSTGLSTGGQDFIIARFESGWSDPDTDGDGISDSADAFPSNASASVDTDGDGKPDTCVGTCTGGLVLDADDDGDGVADTTDAFPLDPTETVDTDGDGIGDNSDPTPNGEPPLFSMPGATKTDKTGASVAFAGDFNNDGYGDFVIGIPGSDAAAKDAGRVEVISGKDGSLLKFINGTAAKDALGTAVAGGADIDEDGFDDVVIGAPNAGANHAGSVVVLFGPDGTRTQPISGTVAKSLFGTAVALGDVNNDGNADILIGAPKDDDAENKLKDAGSVTVISGDGLAPLETFYGATAKAGFGTSVATGKVDAVAGADIIIGAPNDGGTGSVTVYNQAAIQLLKVNGAAKKSLFGKSVASGDVNNDSFDDVLIGAPGDDNGKLKDVGSVTVLSGNGGSQLTKQFGATAKSNLGNSIAAGDVNGDGYADIIIGAWKDDKPGTKLKDAGSVSVFSGNGFAQIGSTRYGDVAKDYFGAAVSAGDINGDGKDDLIIGIPGFDLSVKPAIKDAGKVMVLSGAGL